ncbi:AlpA family transcriptional regulator [Sulfurimonas sp. SWIR-19]|nr:AlpA family transcriptional regulator [Sulfurimonas sp. SWIR-19]
MKTKIDRILKLKEVIAATGLSRSTIYNYMSLNQFPKSIQLTPRRIGWRESDIINYLNSKS